MTTHPVQTVNYCYEQVYCSACTNTIFQGRIKSLSLSNILDREISVPVVKCLNGDQKRSGWTINGAKKGWPVQVSMHIITL